MQTTIEAIWNNRELLKQEEHQLLIRQIIEDLDKGKLALRRIKKYCENYSPDVDKTIKLKLGA